MVNLTIDSELDRMRDALALFNERNQRFIVMNTLNNAAFKAQRQLKADTPRYIENPTPFTVNSSQVIKATQANLTATVDYKSSLGIKGSGAGDYLKAPTYGGERRHKRFEGALKAAGLIPSGLYAVPTENAPRNQYGNVPGSYYVQMLSFLRAFSEQGFNANRSRRIAKYERQKTSKFLKQFVKGVRTKEKRIKADERKRAKAARFVVFIQGRNGWTAASGVYERTTTLGGKRDSGLRLVFAFIPKPKYEKTFPFYEILGTSARAYFPDAFREAVQRELMGLAKRASKVSSSK